MSDATEAWEEWLGEQVDPYRVWADERSFDAGFHAGEIHALEQAADDYEQSGIIPGYPDKHWAAGWLLARAAQLRSAQAQQQNSQPNTSKGEEHGRSDHIVGTHTSEDTP